MHATGISLKLNFHRSHRKWKLQLDVESEGWNGENLQDEYFVIKYLIKTMHGMDGNNNSFFKRTTNKKEMKNQDKWEMEGIRESMFR